MNNKKVVKMFPIILFLFVKAYSQDSTKFILAKYLVSIHEIDSSVYHSGIKKGKNEIITNYYIDSLTSFKSRSIVFKLFKFGSYTEHVRFHLALVRMDKINENCIIDCINITEDFNKILSFLTLYKGSFKEMENLKIRTMKRISNEYPIY